ncbi:MAG: MBL fold metallo-hydrolase [Desulfobacteraceae bacterium]|nr:MAG: MBL fold metallo-hydrolase [Desulfobacteraceae bacterium]
MVVTFYGAVREVTGSMHLLSANKDHILLDCGMFQGRRKDAELKNKQFPVDSRLITNMVLSHAHIDHSGRIPLLTKNGFNGRVVCTRTTRDACEYLLMDSAHIQESDAAYLNYKTLRGHLYRMKASNKNSLTGREKSEIGRTLKKGRHELDVATIKKMLDQYHLKTVEPLYTHDDAVRALGYFDGYPYDTPVTIGKSMTATFFDAGHILGSAMTLIQFKENNHPYNVLFTGDIGRFNSPVIKDPTLAFPDDAQKIDLVIMESTYGARHHETVDDLKLRMKEVITRTVENGGSVLIPSFAFGRTQDVVYVLHELYNEGAVPRVPVYVDSPLGNKLTRVYAEHPEVYDRETHETFLEKGENPFSFKEITYTETVQDSMNIMKDTRPHIVVSSSGMCEAGRILHHLRWKIHSPKNTILVVGYMAQHTLGRRIVDQAAEYESSGRQGEPPVVKILGKEYPLLARVEKLSGFSAHADRDELVRFLKTSNLQIRKIAVVHGEEEQSVDFARYLNENGFKAMVPHSGQAVKLDR